MNDHRQRHPLSAAFGDMPAGEFADLVADIKRNGLIAPIITAADGTVLDGWHRYRACLEAGIKPRFEPFDFVVEPAAESAGRTMTEAEFVVAQNAHRRHLTREQKRRIVAELLKAAPDKSNRAIASMAKVDDKTVGAVRTKLEATAEIPQLTKTTGNDGKARPVMRESLARLDDARRETRDLDAQLREARENLDPVSRADEAWRPIRLALTGLHRQIEQAHRLPECAAATKADLTPMWSAVSRFFGPILECVLDLRRDEVAAVRAAKARADAEFKKYAAMRRGIKAQISEDDYHFLLNVLHPDRAPEDRREKFARAFDIVRMLDEYIKATKSGGER